MAEFDSRRNLNFFILLFRNLLNFIIDPRSSPASDSRADNFHKLIFKWKQSVSSHTQTPTPPSPKYASLLMRGILISSYERAYAWMTSLLTSSLIYYWTDVRWRGIYLFNIYPLRKKWTFQVKFQANLSLDETSHGCEGWRVGRFRFTDILGIGLGLFSFT